MSSTTNLSSGQVHIPRNDPEIRPASRNDLICELAVTEKGTINREVFGGRKSKGTGGVGLRIEVDKEDTHATRSQTGRKIDGSRCLAHTPFLIGDRDDFHRVSNVNRARILTRKESHISSSDALFSESAL